MGDCGSDPVGHAWYLSRSTLWLEHDGRARRVGTLRQPCAAVLSKSLAHLGFGGAVTGAGEIGCPSRTRRRTVSVGRVLKISIVRGPIVSVASSEVIEAREGVSQ